MIQLGEPLVYHDHPKQTIRHTKPTSELSKQHDTSAKIKVVELNITTTIPDEMSTTEFVAYGNRFSRQHNVMHT